MVCAAILHLNFTETIRFDSALYYYNKYCEKNPKPVVVHREACPVDWSPAALERVNQKRHDLALGLQLQYELMQTRKILKEKGE